MRVTNKLMNESAVRYMDENLQRMQELQEKVASQKQFQYASENPSGAVYAMNLRSSLEANKAYATTATNTESWMAATDYSLRQMVETAKRAKDLVQQGIPDTLGPSEREALAAELEMVLEQVLDIANTSHQGNFIFAGFKTLPTASDPVPYEGLKNAATGKYDTIQYHGDAGTITRTIGPGQTIAQNVNPSADFQTLFNGIVAARDHLNDSSNPNFQTLIQADLKNLAQSITQISEDTTTNGARQRQVKLFSERLEKTQIELQSLLSKKENVNMAEAISSLRYQETVYQSVLEVGQRTISAINLFDMMG